MRKYDDIEIKTIFEGESNFCKFLENKLRPEPNIGWNIAAGGTVPKSNLGKKLPKEICLKMSLSRKGRPGYWTGKKMSEQTKLKMSESAKAKWAKYNANPILARNASK